MCSIELFPRLECFQLLGFPCARFSLFQGDQSMDCREKVPLQTFLGRSRLWIWGPLIDIISPMAASWVSWMALYSNTNSPFCAWLCTRFMGWCFPWRMRALPRSCSELKAPPLGGHLEATILVWCTLASVFRVFPKWELRLFSPWLQEGEGQNLKLGIPVNRMNTCLSTFCVCFLFLVYSRRKY